MIIHLVSDLHLDIGGHLEMTGGDVLILAGDICEAKELSKEFHSTKLMDRKPGAFPCHDFFEFEVPKYKKVFYVMGNHEHYRGRFDKTKALLESMMPPNVTILENEVVEYEGVMFMGATLWTNLNNGDSLTMYHIKHMLNDYKAIQNHYPEKDLYHKLVPEYTFRTHIKTMQYFRMMLSEHRDKPFVVITHHAPSFVSVPEYYKHDHLMNGGYASDLSEDILDNENIKVWVHGHMHDPVDYKIGETRILANPRGYPGETETNGFLPGLYFEV
jgi:Icc-related predicted phosphoesterase